MAIRVNRVLSKKQNIAGIPADIFLPVIAFDTVVMIFLCLMFGLPAIPIAIFCLTTNIVWAILVAKGIRDKLRKLELCQGRIENMSNS
jgi:hypothetical protein